MASSGKSLTGVFSVASYFSSKAVICQKIMLFLAFPNGAMAPPAMESSLIGTSSDYFVTFEGVVKYIQMLQEKDASATAQKWADQFAKTAVCPECHGAKLNKEALSFRIHDKNIYELSTMDINELYDWLVNVDPYLSSKQQQIAGEILKEIRTRLKFLLDVGLDYLSLNRSSVSLSGGAGRYSVHPIYTAHSPAVNLSA